MNLPQGHARNACNEDRVIVVEYYERLKWKHVMHTIPLRNSGWCQIDAGLWVKPAPVGHVEIAYASARDGSALYEVTTYDDRGRPSDDLCSAQSFVAFETARRVGDMFSVGSLDMGAEGCA